MTALPSIPGFARWRSCEPLLLGWSNDRKYIVTDAEGQTRLLRTAAPEQLENKRRECALLADVAGLGVNASRPIDCGEYEGGVYQLLTWVEGVSMEESLPLLPPCRQYALGVEAGRTLRLIHSLPAPADAPDWEARMNRKMDRKIRLCLDCPIEAPGRAPMIAFINDHRHLLKNRPQSMHHGDYHCGNLLLTPDGHVGVIDFNRFDMGDPWEEFNRIVWCAQISPAFASGRVNGYFEGSPPAEFFELTAMYVFSNQLSSLPWALPFGQQEIDTMLRQACMVMDWYQNATCAVPTWYLPPEAAASL